MGAVLFRHGISSRKFTLHELKFATDYIIHRTKNCSPISYYYYFFFFFDVSSDTIIFNIYRGQEFTTQVTLRQEWTDERLVYDDDGGEYRVSCLLARSILNEYIRRV
jgi:hypothetical protein